MSDTESLYHPGQIVQGSNEGDSIGVDIDPSVPGFVLITLDEDDRLAGSLYLKPSNALIFAAAITEYAKEVAK